ncbi:MAG TPA: acyltransferase [Opitutaceae bacterium]|jgi:peptidoglycan/LPS O-acetylase OafA/YrhL
MNSRRDLGGDAFRKFRAAKFFSSLDGLRAAAIAGVIWHHTGSGPQAGLLGLGNRGVTLFFAISGFLIVTLMLRAKERPAGFSLRNFWGRRMLRIFPVYYAALALYTLLVWNFDSDPAAAGAFFANLPRFATFTSNWFVDLNAGHVIFYFAWSLAAEEQFYLTWPFVERYCRGTVAAGVALVLLFFTRAISIAAGAGGHDNLLVRIPCSVPPAILFGVLLAHVLHHRGYFRFAYSILGRRGSATGFAVLAVAAVAWFRLGGDAGECVISAALALLVGACVIREDNDLAWLLRCRPIAWVGTISYSMYLLHMLCGNLIHTLLAAAHAGRVITEFAPLITFAAAVGAASLCYLTYERFFLSLKDRYFSHAGRSVAPTESIDLGLPEDIEPLAEPPGT